MVSEIESFEVDRNQWTSINYVEKERLRVLYPGSIQVSNKRIFIFGGMTEASEDEAYHIDGQRLTNSKQALYFDVCSGVLKKGEEPFKGVYFLSQSHYFTY